MKIRFLKDFDVFKKNMLYDYAGEDCSAIYVKKPDSQVDKILVVVVPKDMKNVLYTKIYVDN